MYIWFGVLLVLAFLSLVESMMSVSVPFLQLRSLILFLLALGMSYHFYNLEKSSTQESVKEVEENVTQVAESDSILESVEAPEGRSA